MTESVTSIRTRNCGQDGRFRWRNTFIHFPDDDDLHHHGARASSAPPRLQTVSVHTRPPLGATAGIQIAHDAAQSATDEESGSDRSIVAQDEVGSASASAVASYVQSPPSKQKKKKKKKNKAARKLASKQLDDAMRIQAIHKWNQEIDQQSWIPASLDREDMFSMWCTLDYDWDRVRLELMLDD